MGYPECGQLSPRMAENWKFFMGRPSGTSRSTPNCHTITHGFPGQKRLSAVEQLSIRVVCPDGSRNAALSSEAAQLVDRRLTSP